MPSPFLQVVAATFFCLTLVFAGRGSPLCVVPGGGAPLESVSRIQFGPNADGDNSDVLFVADWKQAKIFAFILPPVSENPPPQDQPPFGLNIMDLEKKLGIDPAARVHIEDVAVRPGTYEAFVALTIVDKISDEVTPLVAMFRVDDSNLELNGGSYEILDLANMEHASVDISDLVSQDDLWYNKAGDPVESYTTTDMKFHNGKLYASGLSSLDAASVMRVYDFPFTGNYKTVSIETFNISHNQWEKRAPILNFLIETVDLEQWGSNGERLGKVSTDVIVAAFLCTPLAYLPLDLITNAEEKATVRSRAIAEIGDGGTPLGFFRYSSISFGTKEPTEKVMVVSMYRNSKNIPWETIVNAMNASPEGLTCGKNGSPWTFEGYENGDLAGMKFGILGPYRRMTLMPDLSKKGEAPRADRLLGLRRDAWTGKVELVSSLPNLDGTRLSDMTIEEYWWKSYVPEPNGMNQKVLRAQAMSFKLEGYPDAIPPLIEGCPTSCMPCELKWKGASTVPPEEGPCKVPPECKATY